MTDVILTQYRLKSLLNYNPTTGIFTRVGNGNVAGSINSEGYRNVYVEHKLYKAHRLSWLYVYGKWPKDQLDHINNNRADNRICNLRECNNRLNQQNLEKSKTNNKCGLLGVFFCKRTQKYCASIRNYGKLKHLGYFEDKFVAHEAYLKAKADIHEFAK